MNAGALAQTKAELLLVDDDESLRRVTSYHLEQAGYAVRTVATAEDALREIDERPPSLVITDVLMPGSSGVDLLRTIKSRWAELGVVVITAHGSIEQAVEAMRAGAHDYLLKPFAHESLLLTIEKALRLDALVRENERLRALAGGLLRFEGLIATSSALKAVLEQAEQVAARDTTVLLLGESGTGKELLARAIQQSSPRREGPFVTVNVGSLPGSLIDSELFGHVKGAFTGAAQTRRGKFELADGGTIFLDEIGDLAPELQGKLLRVLQDGEIQRLGEERTRHVDVRVIAATNRNLERMVSDGEFREDLYYRLSIVPLTLPPLRARKDDIPPLVAHFLRKSGASSQFDGEAMSLLQRYDWPGNVRELENVVERAVVLNPAGPLGSPDLPERLRTPAPTSARLLGELPEEGLSLEAVERELIERALRRCGDNQSATARYLGITRNTLLYRMEKYGLR